MKEQRDIEWLVNWALVGQGLGGESTGGDSMSRLAKLGTRVDTSPVIASPSIGLLDNNDAFKVMAAINKLPVEARALITQYGRASLQPEWGEGGYGVPEQMRNRRGQLQWIYRDKANRRGKIAPMLDWPAYDKHIFNVDYDRAAWTVWREALVALKNDLIGALDSFDPTGPRAKQQPWAGLSDEGPVSIPFAQTSDAKRQTARSEVRRQASDWTVPKPEQQSG